MTVTELLPVLHRLNRADKLCVMQYLVGELAREEEAKARANEETCPIWATPDTSEQDEPWPEPEGMWSARESFEAARALLRQRKIEVVNKTDKP